MGPKEARNAREAPTGASPSIVTLLGEAEVLAYGLDPALARAQAIKGLVAQAPVRPADHWLRLEHLGTAGAPSHCPPAEDPAPDS